MIGNVLKKVAYESLDIECNQYNLYTLFDVHTMLQPAKLGPKGEPIRALTLLDWRDWRE